MFLNVLIISESSKCILFFIDLGRLDARKYRRRRGQDPCKLRKAFPRFLKNGVYPSTSMARGGIHSLNLRSFARRIQRLSIPFTFDFVRIEMIDAARIGRTMSSSNFRVEKHCGFPKAKWRLDSDIPRKFIDPRYFEASPLSVGHSLRSKRIFFFSFLSRSIECIEGGTRIN